MSVFLTDLFSASPCPCYFIVQRCWAYETGVLLGRELEEAIPYNDFFEYYAPDFKLHLVPVISS